MTITQNNVTLALATDPNEVLEISSVQQSGNDKHFLNIAVATNFDVGAKLVLTINYIGNLNDDLDGFYRSSYVNYRGETTWLGVTQFSPTGARRAFPCFDEPSYKAKFTIHVAREPLKVVTSNMRVAAANRPVEGLDGWVWVDFEQTLLTPTFVVAFTVHDFGYVQSEVDDRFRIYARAELVERATGYALEMAPKILQYLEHFTNFSYDESMKLDQLAIPDFAPNAMENWGHINYREVALLYDNFSTSTTSKQKTVTVMSHEIAHFWFGNLVTPAWWNEVWLKEGFATYFQYFAADKFENLFQLEQAFIGDELQPVLLYDSRALSHPLSGQVDSPASILSGFDSIAYNKGGAIMRFLTAILGKDNFEKAIKHYVDKNKYGSVTKDSYWDSLSTELPPNTLPAGVNLSEVMDTWATQPGFPVITASRNYETKEITFSQQRFYSSGKDMNSTEEWYVPITMVPESGNANWQDLSIKGWLVPTENLTLTENLPNNTEWIVLNPRQTGFYRVNYDQKNWELIFATLNHKDKWRIILDINRAQLIDDAMALARAKHLSYETALAATEYLTIETEYLPWSTAFKAFNFIGDRLVGIQDERAVFYPLYVTNKLLHLYDEVNGFVINDNDGLVERKKRSLALNWACHLGHQNCKAEASTKFQEWKSRPAPDYQNPVHPDLRSVVYCHGIKTEADFDFLLERYARAQSSPAEMKTILAALGCAPTEELLEKFLNETAKTEGSIIRSQDSKDSFAAVINNPVGVEVALNFLVTRYDDIKLTYQSFGSVGSLFSMIASKLNTEDQKAKLEQFLVDYPNEEDVKPVVQSSIATVEENIEWLLDHKDSVLNFFKAKGTNAASITVISPFLVILVAIFTMST
ncbi:Hypothetical predicted protein [Cloeon dipterum]|nr:Hypothetical predicted protein [Cloeon dipterum]